MGMKHERWPEVVCLATVLGVDLLAAVAVAWTLPFGVPTTEYYSPAIEFATKHRIASDFLSIGYSAVLGLGYALTGSRAGMTIANTVLSLLLIAAVWAFLRQIGMSVKATLALTSLLSVYPDFLTSYNKVQDTSITAALLFGFLALLLVVGRKEKFGGPDLGLALLLGAAVLVRPNLVLLVPLAWIEMWRVKAPKTILRSSLQAIIVVVCYLVVTTVVHGRPFLPKNGPYNLCAGANPFTAEHIENAEGSLIYVLAAHGIHAGIDWHREPDTPGVNDVRDAQFRPLYSRWAWEYVRTHKWMMAKLSWMKLVNMMSPDLRRHRLRSAAGLMKVFACLAIPLWAVGMLALRHPGPTEAKVLIIALVLVYALPFVLIVSAQRFRVPLDFLCWMDLGAMLIAWYQGRRGTGPARTHGMG